MKTINFTIKGILILALLYPVCMMDIIYEIDEINYIFYIYLNQMCFIGFLALMFVEYKTQKYFSAVISCVVALFFNPFFDKYIKMDNQIITYYYWFVIYLSLLIAVIVSVLFDVYWFFFRPKKL